MASEVVLDSNMYIRHGLNEHVLDRNLSVERDNAIRAKLGYDLLMYDTVAIPTHDFGIIPILANWMGLDILQSAVSNRSLIFIRMPHVLVYVGNGVGISRANIVTPGQRSKPLPWYLATMWQSDAVALEEQIRHRLPAVDRGLRENIVQLIMQNTTEYNPTIDKFNEQVAHETYRDILSNSSLANSVTSGLPPDTQLAALPGIGPADVRWHDGELLSPNDRLGYLLRAAEFNMELDMAYLAGGADLETVPLAASVLDAKLKRAGISDRSRSDFAKIRAIEGVPDIEYAIARNEVSIPEMWHLRECKSASRFRKWMRDASNHRNGDIAQAYRDVCFEVRGADAWPVKALRFVATNALGYYCNLPLSIAVSAADSWFVSALGRGYQPRMFLRQMEQLVRKNQ